MLPGSIEAPFSSLPLVGSFNTRRGVSLDTPRSRWLACCHLLSGFGGSLVEPLQHHFGGLAESLAILRVEAEPFILVVDDGVQDLTHLAVGHFHLQ